ncbi:MAG: mechanosensitive ion channel [Robiginitomaculum sp.]|nr:mechanosensitive ion channel [Robiginitomaculum sp.]
MFARKFIFVFFSVLLMAMGASLAAFAQNKNEQSLLTVPISEAELKASISAIESDANISDEDKTLIVDLYKNARAKIAEGKASELLAKDFAAQLENAPGLIKVLERDTIDVRKTLRRSRADMMRDYSGQSLGELEQNLVQERAKVTTLRGLKGQYEQERQALDTRPAQALEEIAALEQGIAGRIANLNNANSENISKLEQAATALSRANLYAERQKKRALEQEIASIAARRKVLDKRISLNAAQINQSNDLVSALQERTGFARTDDALVRLEDAQREAEEFLSDHPVVQAYALENVVLAQQNLDIAKSEGDLPEIEADISIKLQQVRLDANVTKQILDSRKVNKAYGEHLRSLRKKQPSISTIQQQIKKREIDLQDALFQRITTQEGLDIFNATPLDVDALKRVYDLQNGVTPALSETDTEHLQRAYDSRRGHLNELATVSSLRTRKLEEVNALHNQYLKEVKALCELLDSRLLWLPSTEALGFSWPGKVVQGMLQTFTAGNLAATGKAFVSGLRNTYFLVFLALGFLAALHMVRERLKPTISAMGSRVGRVQKDGYSLTPLALFDGVARSVIMVGLIGILGVVFAFSGSESAFVKTLSRLCFILVGPLFVFLCLRAWSFKGGLFDLHFRVDRQLRNQLQAHIPWLAIVMSISIILAGLANGILDFDSSTVSLGVFGFLIGALGIAWFSLKIAWSRSKVFTARSRETDSIYLRNERWFLALGVIVPLGTALLAALGYFETARLLLSRFFLSFCVVLAAYIVHGLLKRTLVIAQRRLALEQARARRDRAVKERMEKAAAEERGEIPVPKVDTDSIDLETINRQSKQLINVTVFVVTIGALWALWSNVLPALSVFDDVELWSYMDVTKPDGPQTIPITLWNVMQALGIGLITWLAARNLPGFLEMFVLKRVNMAQSSRFAIVTVLGYIIFLVGVLVAFDKLGTQWSQLQWIVAAFGVGIGFGLQAIFANFISGLIILFERPVRIGDYVTIGEISGTVTRIQIRATTLLDLDNKEILIPNQELVTQQVTNWTLANPVTRLIIKVGIAYGSDTELAHKTMLEAIKQNPNVLNNPEPTVLFLGFGDSTLDFDLRVFLRDFTQRFIVSHELHMAIDAALRDANIEIAFPQRDLHIKNPELLKIFPEGD